MQKSVWKVVLEFKQLQTTDVLKFRFILLLRGRPDYKLIFFLFLTPLTPDL